MSGSEQLRCSQAAEPASGDDDVVVEPPLSRPRLNSGLRTTDDHIPAPPALEHSAAVRLYEEMDKSRSVAASVLENTIYSSSPKEIATSASAIVYAIRFRENPTIPFVVKVFFIPSCGKNEHGFMRKLRSVSSGCVRLITDHKFFVHDVDVDRLRHNAAVQQKKTGTAQVGVMVLPRYNSDFHSFPKFNLRDFTVDLIAVVRQFHARGVAHLDIRTDNILHDGHKHFFIIDFDSSVLVRTGASVSVGGGASATTSTHCALNISTFEKNMEPPEMLDFKAGTVVDVCKLDMWFIGMMLIRLLCNDMRMNYMPTHVINREVREIVMVCKEEDYIVETCCSETKFRSFLASRARADISTEDRDFIIHIIVNLMYVYAPHRNFVV